MKKKFKYDEPANIDNLLVARRLAQFCPTSLSIDDLKGDNRSSFHMASTNSSEKIEEPNQNKYIPPTPSVRIEKSPSTQAIESKSPFKLGIEPAKHRFGFLLADIKPISQGNVNLHKSKSTVLPVKVKYELPNVKKVDTPVKSVKPLMVVSFSSTNLNQNGNSPLKSQTSANLPRSPLFPKTANPK